MVDWATLPKDLLDLISKFLESSVDLVHFRSVCSSWRSAAEPKPPLPTHHLPILPNNGGSLFPDSAVGFRLSQRSIVLIKPHEEDSFGWLVKLDEELSNNGHRKLTFLDPLSDKRNSFPEHFPRSLDMSKFKVRELGREFKLHYFNTVGDIVESLYLEKAVVKYLDRGPDYRFVLVTIHVSGKLAVYRSWTREWTVINDMPSPYDDVFLFDGRFFAVDNNGRTVVVDFSSLKLALAAEAVFGGDKKFLIESCGEMLLVDMYLSMEAVDGDHGFVEEIFEHQTLYVDERTVKFKVFKYVEREKNWVKVEDLGDKMLFLGDDCTFSASASDILPRCSRGSSVFFNGNVINEEDLGARDLGIFDFMTGKIEMVNKLPEYAKLFWPPPPWITSPQTCYVDEITYFAIIDKINRKVPRIGIGGDNSRLKLSFIMMVNNHTREVEVFDDDDVYGYLRTFDKVEFITILNVKVIKDMKCYHIEEISKVGGGSSFGVNYEEMDRICRYGGDVNNDGIVTIYRSGATKSQYIEPVIKESEIDSGERLEAVDCCINNIEDDYVDLPKPLEKVSSKNGMMVHVLN